MSLLITITRAPDSVALSESSKSFDTQGGSIGRGKDSNWVLDDPERFLSSCHCRVSHENGQYFLTDLSTNGTFMNGAPNPLGKGNRHVLTDGDTFVLGDYEFTVSLWNPVGAQPADVDTARPGPFASSTTHSDDLFSAPVPASDDFSSLPMSSAGGSPFDNGIVSQSDSLFTMDKQETDPLKLLDKIQGPSQLNNDFSSHHSTDPFADQGSHDLFSTPSFSDQASPVNQQVTWPDAIVETTPQQGAIPDDWDDDLLSPSMPAASSESNPGPQTADLQFSAHNTASTEILPASQQAAPGTSDPIPLEGSHHEQEKFLNTGQFDVSEGEVSPLQQATQEKANARIQAELEILKQQIKKAQQQGSTSEVTVDTSLIENLGFTDRKLDDQEITEINRLTGDVMREMVSGLMQVLSSRSSIKNEFRMNVTTIQPVENNPLKFSANVDDALENMFIKQGNAYMKPVDAVREGFSSIAEHQVAILAGIRAAFKGVIERFDPITLEQRFAKQNKGGLIPGMQKARNWELYQDYFNELASDIDNSFQYLFGHEFVSAYEDQLQKLAISRKSSKTNGNPDKP